MGRQTVAQSLALSVQNKYFREEIEKTKLELIQFEHVVSHLRAESAHLRRAIADRDVIIIKLKKELRKIRREVLANSFNIERLGTRHNTWVNTTKSVFGASEDWLNELSTRIAKLSKVIRKAD